VDRVGRIAFHREFPVLLRPAPKGGMLQVVNDKTHIRRFGFLS
jgi:hypothetical protein